MIELCLIRDIMKYQNKVGQKSKKVNQYNKDKEKK